MNMAKGVITLLCAFLIAFLFMFAVAMVLG
jgi:hypothetical protein